MFTVAPHCQIMEQLGLEYLYRNLHAIYVINFLSSHIKRLSTYMKH